MLRNAVFNLAAQVWLIGVTFVSTPIIFRFLGAAAYGVLSTVFAVMGYLAAFDLVGVATVRFLAERLSAGSRKDVARLVSTALLTQGALGVIGFGILLLCVPVLVERVLRVPPELQTHARWALVLVGVGLPLVLVSSVFEGILMSLQRFDILGAARMILGVLRPSLVILLLMAGFGLVGTVAAIVAMQFLQVTVMALVGLWLLPELKTGFRWAADEFSALLRFGSWITVSGIVGPLLYYLDRFVLAMLVSMSAVGYYSIPSDALSKLWVIPTAVSPVLFPIFTTLRFRQRDRATLGDLYFRAQKYVLVTMVPAVIIVIIYAPEILQLWMGKEVALHSTQVMRIIAVGILIGSLSWIPSAFVQACGRPDLRAKFLLAEVLPYVALCFWLTRVAGIAGAALGADLRLLGDMVLLTVATSQIMDVPVLTALRRVFGGWTLLLTGGLMITVAAAWRLEPNSIESHVLVATVLGLYLIGVWRLVMLSGERQAAVSLFKMRPTESPRTGYRFKVGSLADVAPADGATQVP